jgi:polyphosphate kinase
MSNLEIDRTEVYRVPDPVSLSRLISIYGINRSDLKDASFVPAIPAELAGRKEEDDLFATIARQDVLLHHPYECSRDQDCSLSGRA